MSNVFFECNLPTTAPNWIDARTAPKMTSVFGKVISRNANLQKALDISGMRGEDFSRAVAEYFKKTPVSLFDKKTPEQLAKIGELLWDGDFTRARIDFPNAITVCDTRFTTEEEWVMIRHLFIGGSDTSAVLGSNTYTGMKDLWADKTGKPALKPEKKNSALERGHFFEPLVISAFVEKINKNKEKPAIKLVEETRMFQSRKFPYLAANVDAILLNENNDIFVMEAKTANTERFTDWSGGKIPAYYQSQMRFYPAVIDDDRIKGTFIGCTFIKDMSFSDIFVSASAVTGEDGEPEVTYRFLERDKDMEKDLLESCNDFYEEYVVRGIEPDELPHDTSAYIQKFVEPKTAAVKPVLKDPETRGLLSLYLKGKNEKSRLNKEIKKNELVAAGEQAAEKLKLLFDGYEEISFETEDGEIYNGSLKAGAKTVADLETFKVAMQAARPLLPDELFETLSGCIYKDPHGSAPTLRISEPKKKEEEK